MSNPMIDNIRRSLGRVHQSPTQPRARVYPPRQPESMECELERFLNEVKLLSGAGQQMAPGEIAQALKTLVSECNIHKATFWSTPLFETLRIEDALLECGSKTRAAERLGLTRQSLQQMLRRRR